MSIAAACRRRDGDLFACPIRTFPLDSVEIIEFIARRACETGVVGINYLRCGHTRAFRERKLAEMGITRGRRVRSAFHRRQIGRFSDALVMQSRPFPMRQTFDVMVIQHPEEPALSSGGPGQ